MSYFIWFDDKPEPSCMLFYIVKKIEKKLNVELFILSLQLSKPMERSRRSLSNMERKTFELRFEDEFGGTSISILVQSPGTISPWVLKKEEIGWFLEDLRKAAKMDSFLGFNRKYRRKIKVYLIEVRIMRARTRKY